MDLRPYQSAAVSFLLPRVRGFIESPAGSGKTVIASNAAAQVAQPFERVAWVANTKEQCEQARAAIIRCQWADPVDISVHCAAARPSMCGVDLLILDECHHLPAATWLATAEQAPGRVWGFSATPWHRDTTRNDILCQFFGEGNFHRVCRGEVKAGGHLADGMVVFHDIDQPGEFEAEISERAAADVQAQQSRFCSIPTEELERRARWRWTAEYTRQNSRRNTRIVELATCPESCLVLVGTIEHGQHIEAQIPGAVLVHAKIGKKRREAAISGFRAGSIRCMIATSLADEGLDVPIASVLVMASGGRSSGKIEQRAGRVLRPYPGKSHGVIHDFTDRGSVMGFAQARARQRIYKKLDYTITTQ